MEKINLKKKRKHGFFPSSVSETFVTGSTEVSESNAHLPPVLAAANLGTLSASHSQPAQKGLDNYKTNLIVIKNYITISCTHDIQNYDKTKRMQSYFQVQTVSWLQHRRTL